MRVLVTGHKGYIGSVMTPLLAEYGHSCVGLDACYYGGGTPGPLSEDIPALRKDVRDIQIEDLSGCDVIIHLAGLSYDRLGELDRELTHEINYKASVRLAEMAREAGVQRFVFASSCSVYGVSQEAPLNEGATLRPLSPYAESKARVEEAISKMADTHFSPVSLRLATVYGYSPNLRTDLVLNNFVAWASTTGKVLIKSEGAAWRPIAHVEDISRAFVAILNAPRARVHNQVFNVGSNDENYQVRDLATMVEELVPGCVVEYARNSSDPRSYRVDFGKLLQGAPDYQPIWNAKLGVHELRQVYQRWGLSIDQLQASPFVRLKRLKKLQDAKQLDSTLRWIKQ